MSKTIADFSQVKIPSSKVKRGLLLVQTWNEGYAQGLRDARAQFARDNQQLSMEERQAAIRSAESLKHIAQSLAVTAESITKLHLSINKHL